MNILVLGKGKTGALVAEVAAERGHQVRSMDADENPDGAGLTEDSLRGIDAAIDFTTPDAVLKNISACARLGVNLVVGTTGWQSELDYVKRLIADSNTGMVYGSNFSVGVNLYLEVARAAAMALNRGYTMKIVERHHQHKMDAPSGTAVTMQKVIAEVSGVEPEITSLREGETIGTHVMLLDSANDTMMLVHDAKSRRGFAEGAVLAAEWIPGKKGFFEFKDVIREIYKAGVQ